MIETAKIVQAVCYILDRTGKADKLKIVKLLFLADKCHLIRYGRTITGDDYWAMEYGPVGSATKDVLTFDKDFGSNELEYASTFLKKVGEHEIDVLAPCNPESLDLLSETDVEALRIVVEKYGHLSTHDLILHTHRYPEWARYRKLFDAKQTKRERIYASEIFSILPGDPFDMPNEHVEESRRILTGLCD